MSISADTKIQYIRKPANRGVHKMGSSPGGRGRYPFVPGTKGNFAAASLIYILHDPDRLNQAAAQTGSGIRTALISCQSGLFRHPFHLHLLQPWHYTEKGENNETLLPVNGISFGEKSRN